MSAARVNGELTEWFKVLLGTDQGDWGLLKGGFLFQFVFDTILLIVGLYYTS